MTRKLNEIEIRDKIEWIIICHIDISYNIIILYFIILFFTYFIYKYFTYKEFKA